MGWWTRLFHWKNMLMETANSAVTLGLMRGAEEVDGLDDVTQVEKDAMKLGMQVLARRVREELANRLGVRTTDQD